MRFFKKPLRFDWDEGTRYKNWKKHKITKEECEEVFFDPHKRLLGNSIRSGLEERYLMVGTTKGIRMLFVVFTLRRDKIRIISARDMHRRERRLG
jgi:uncharacterized protein